MKIKKNKLQFQKIDRDHPALQEVISEFSIIQNLSETHMYPGPMPRELYFLIEKEDQPIGMVALQNIKWYNRKAEITIVIVPKFQKRGFGTQALSFIMEFAFHQLNFHRLEAEVYDYNQGSIRLLEKLGFTKEGVLREAKYADGKYHDIIRYGILKDEYKKQ